MVSGILRAVGDFKNPLYFLLLSSILNIVFVVVFKMGIADVAIATSLSQITSTMLAIILLYKSKSMNHLDFQAIRFYPGVLHDTIKLGMPSAMQNAVISLSNIIMQTNINIFGAYAMAGMFLESFGFL